MTGAGAPRRSPAVQEAAGVLGRRAQRDAPLGALTTYRVGGTAALRLDVSSTADLDLARRAVSASGVEVLVVGRGSNLLVSDAGFDGLAVVMGEAVAGIDIDAGAGLVRAGGGAALPVIARRSSAAGLGGLEWCVGVPGSAGGAVRMNAGGHGADTAATLVRCEVVDLAGGRHGIVSAGDLALGYRCSNVAPSEVVVWVEHALGAGHPADSEAMMNDIVRWRREHQPGGQNAGSVFTNPPGDAAGRLVEAAGLKGHRRGSAQVSPRHANFVQADPGGSADDVLALVREVQQRVEEETGVRLEVEVRLVGFAGAEGRGPR